MEIKNRKIILDIINGVDKLFNDGSISVLRDMGDEHIAYTEYDVNRGGYRKIHINDKFADDENIIRGLLHHEHGHVAFTVIPNEALTDPRKKMIHNLLEDIRLEHILSLIFPGIKNKFHKIIIDNMDLKITVSSKYTDLVKNLFCIRYIQHQHEVIQKAQYYDKDIEECLNLLFESMVVYESTFKNTLSSIQLSNKLIKTMCKKANKKYVRCIQKAFEIIDNDTNKDQPLFNKHGKSKTIILQDKDNTKNSQGPTSPDDLSEGEDEKDSSSAQPTEPEQQNKNEQGDQEKGDTSEDAHEQNDQEGMGEETGEAEKEDGKGSSKDTNKEEIDDTETDNQEQSSSEDNLSSDIDNAIDDKGEDRDEVVDDDNGKGDREDGEESNDNGSSGDRDDQSNIDESSGESKSADNGDKFDCNDEGTEKVDMKDLEEALSNKIDRQIKNMSKTVQNIDVINMNNKISKIPIHVFGKCKCHRYLDFGSYYCSTLEYKVSIPNILLKTLFDGRRMIRVEKSGLRMDSAPITGGGKKYLQTKHDDFHFTIELSLDISGSVNYSTMYREWIVAASIYETFKNVAKIRISAFSSAYYLLDEDASDFPNLETFYRAGPNRTTELFESVKLAIESIPPYETFVFVAITDGVAKGPRSAELGINSIDGTRIYLKQIQKKDRFVIIMPVVLIDKHYIESFGKYRISVLDDLNDPNNIQNFIDEFANLIVDLYQGV